MYQDQREDLTPSQLLISEAVSARLHSPSVDAHRLVVTETEVAALINRLSTGKSPGVDGVTTEHLIHGQSHALLSALARLLSECLNAGRVPSAFAHSTIVPLLKKSSLDPNCMDNYRPISITTCSSKLLELLLLDKLENSFVPHELQFGFVRNRGTAQASLLSGETVQWHLRRRMPVFAANLDARKCYDRIWHDGLLYRVAEHIDDQSWRLLLTWYRSLTARIAFSGQTSNSLGIERGTRQGAILSPTLANISLYPLLEMLDRSGLGACLHGAHVPAVCYADDLLLVTANARALNELLKLVGEFAAEWRLEFVHPDSSKTKSHCIVFGGEMLALMPKWTLTNQQLQVRTSSEHLGLVMQSQFVADRHVELRIRRAQAAFYALTPVGLFSTRLSAADKAFLWKTVVMPTLLFGCDIAPLSASDIDSLEACQTACIKAALRLPRSAHHSALLIALGIPRVHECLRRAVFRSFASSFNSDHRLRQIFVRSLALLAVNSADLTGSFLHHVYMLCNCQLAAVMEAATGRIDCARIRAPVSQDGLVDSIRFVLGGQCPESRFVLGLLTMPGYRSGE